MATKTNSSQLDPVDRLIAESEIRRLITTYAHNVDDGKISENAQLLADARFQVVDAVVVGRDEVARFFINNVQHHADGTPRTWHAISNTIIDVDSATSAKAVSYFTVHQELPGLPLQPIVTGLYTDTFEYIKGEWRFTSRWVQPRLSGELRHHVATPATHQPLKQTGMATKRQALVTGANKGIGLAIARGLAEAGMSVWIGARDRVRGQQAVQELRDDGLDVRLLEIDVADNTSVQRAAAMLSAEIDALHVLVNNAGILVDATTPPSQVRMDDVKATFEVNLFGPIRVTQAFIPLLKAAADARVVMMGSGLGSLTLITDPTSIYSSVNLLDYTSSKVALNAVTVAFAKELEPFGIKVNIVEPGHVQTDLNGNTGVLTPKEGAATALKMALVGSDGPTGGFFASHGRQPW